MTDAKLLTDGPLVSLLLCTFNRRQYLPESLGSAVRQTYRNLEIIVLNDGGEDVADIVESFNDPRITFINRKENRGYAHSLNEAIDAATGKYIAYLGDDDFHYPQHIQLLVEAVEGPTDCQVAYSNLYRTMCRILPDGRRVALGKTCDIRRNFDRYFMFHINHVLGGSLLHSRALVDKTGPYDPEVRVFVDWYMTRLLAFYSDFAHVNLPTGEFCIPVENESDRISFKGRQDPAEFLKNVTRIKTTRPPKPWPKMKDTSIIYAPPAVDQRVVNTLGAVLKHTFMPYLVYLSMPADQFGFLDHSDFPGVIVPVHVDADSSYPQRIEAALYRCDGDMVALLPDGMAVEMMWLERGAYPLATSETPNEAFYFGQAANGQGAAVFRREELLAASRNATEPTIDTWIEAGDIQLRKPPRDRLPMMLDDFYTTAKHLETECGDTRLAGQIYEKLPDQFANDLWMKECEATLLFEQGEDDEKAVAICREINEAVPTPKTLLLEAKLHRRADRPHRAVQLLEQAKEILQWKA
ncbi:MAG: glycosyltransferase family 2 protein [Planctomycetota bacterium]|jgi:glycosyltransferase involved in cell wall biosynthesis